MARMIQYLIIVAFVSLTPWWWGCHSSTKSEPPKKRIFYLNSYHRGYPSSDQVSEGILSEVDTTRYDLTVFYLDAKRISGEPLNIRAMEARDSIEEYDPDILIVSDDNAMKSVIMPFYKEGTLPIVFCGVNWSAAPYDLPARIVGMEEVLPVEECIAIARAHNPGLRLVTVISEKSTSEEMNRNALLPLFQRLNLTVDYTMVDSFDAWKKAYEESQQKSDLIFLPTNGAIRGWNDREAQAFVTANLRVPSFTCDDFMMPYAVFGLTKVASEQGIWAARSALSLLNGTQPDEIGIVQNKEQNCYLNPSLADRINFTLPDFCKNCKIITP